MNQSSDLDKLATALAKAQDAFEVAGKDKTASIVSQKGSYRYAYADLPTVVAACRKALSANGLSVVQSCSSEGMVVTISTRLLHASGQWISDEDTPLRLKARDESPQAIGSASTYGRRYSLMALVGVMASDEDDDGHEAQPRPREQQEYRPTVQILPAQERQTPPQRPQEVRGQVVREGGRVNEGNAKAGEGAPAWSATPEGMAFAEVTHLLTQVWPGADGQAERLSWWWARYAANSRQERPADWTPGTAWSQSDDKRKAKILETAKALVESEVHPEDRR